MMSSPSPSPDSANIGPKPADGKNIVTLQRVSHHYPGGPAIFSDIDMELMAGSFTFLTGASGAGKSTLLKLLYMGLAPTSGHISLFGSDIRPLPAKARQALRRLIGVVSQEFSLIDHLDLFQNVALPLRITGASRDAYADDVIELLRWVGLGEQMSNLPPTLSGGERQRVAIARAVMARPRLLIADEPTGNVDPEMGERLLRLLTEMNRGGTTILIATHDESLMTGIQADRLHLENGQLTWSLSA